jgi:hypothetical protein
MVLLPSAIPIASQTKIRLEPAIQFLLETISKSKRHHMGLLV